MERNRSNSSKGTKKPSPEKEKKSKSPEPRSRTSSKSNITISVTPLNNSKQGIVQLPKAPPIAISSAMTTSATPSSASPSVPPASSTNVASSPHTPSLSPSSSSSSMLQNSNNNNNSNSTVATSPSSSSSSTAALAAALSASLHPSNSVSSSVSASTPKQITSPTMPTLLPRVPMEIKERQVVCDIFNRETLTEYFMQHVFSDLVLVGPTGERHEVHRVVMARGSQWIHRQLEKKELEKDTTKWTLEISFPDPGNVLPHVIRALYTGQIEITKDRATAINTLARHLEIEFLVKQVAEYLSSTVQRHNCVSMLRQAIELHADDVADACIKVVARNFSLLNEKDWNWLSYELFLKLLQAEFFQAESETAVYELTRGYIAAHKNKLSSKQIRTLQEETRFRFFTLQQMRDVFQRDGDDICPRDLLLEGALARLEAFEKPSDDGAEFRLVGTKPHLKRRQRHGLPFPYTPDLEMKGIIHYLATNAGKDEYANPHLAGVVLVSASSLERGVISDLVSSEANELWTRPVPASWFCVDFKTRRVRPHHYSLRHGGLHKTDFLRHWDLLGSNDHENWTLIRRHTADNSLQAGKFAVSTWEVNCPKAFRLFRVIQTGHNSSRHNFLALSGFEVYGELFSENDVTDEERT